MKDYNTKEILSEITPVGNRQYKQNIIIDQITEIQFLIIPLIETIKVITIDYESLYPNGIIFTTT